MPTPRTEDSYGGKGMALTSNERSIETKQLLYIWEGVCTIEASHT